MLSTTLLTVLALAAAPQAQDPHWYAFEGCWRATPQQEGAPLLCLKEAEGDLLMATYIKGELKSGQRINANGVARPISEGGCSGDEIARWSSDGARVFVRAKLSCGSGMDRLTTSALALTGPETLVEVRSLRVGDGSTVRTMRYTEVGPSEYPADFKLTAGRELARETARVHAAAPMDVQDVIEAGKQVEAGTVEALLAARASGFALNADMLRQLKAAGVPRSTLDVLVALSYPDAFRLAEASPRNADRSEWGSPYYDPFLTNPYYRYDCVGLNYYSSWACDYRYGYGYYGYSPYGYNRYGGYGGWYTPYGWPYGNGVVVVPVGDDNGAGGSVGSGGYTSGSQPTRGTARRRGDDSYTGSGARASTSPSGGGSSRPSSSGGSSSGGSGGSSVSGGGYTSGGGSSQGTAKPRGGGR